MVINKILFGVSLYAVMVVNSTAFAGIAKVEVLDNMNKYCGIGDVTSYRDSLTKLINAPASIGVVTEMIGLISSVNSLVGEDGKNVYLNMRDCCQKINTDANEMDLCMSQLAAGMQPTYSKDKNNAKSREMYVKFSNMLKVMESAAKNQNEKMADYLINCEDFENKYGYTFTDFEELDKIYRGLPLSKQSTLVTTLSKFFTATGTLLSDSDTIMNSKCCGEMSRHIGKKKGFCTKHFPASKDESTYSETTS